MDREKIARVIYDCWPDTYNYRRMTTQTTQDGYGVTERAVGVVTWDELHEERPERVTELLQCADKIIDAINNPGHPGDNP